MHAWQKPEEEAKTITFVGQCRKILQHKIATLYHLKIVAKLFHTPFFFANIDVFGFERKLGLEFVHLQRQQLPRPIQYCQKRGCLKETNADFMMMALTGRSLAVTHLKKGVYQKKC